MTRRVYITCLHGWTSRSLNFLIIFFMTFKVTLNSRSVWAALWMTRPCAFPLFFLQRHRTSFPFWIVFLFTGAGLWVGWWCIWYSLFRFIERCSHGTLSQFMGALKEKQWRCSRVEIDRKWREKTGHWVRLRGRMFLQPHVMCCFVFWWCTICGGVCH